MQGIKVIIFDLGGVILKITWLTRNPAFIGKCSEPKEKVEHFFQGEIWHCYEKGRISTANFMRLAMSQIGYLGTEAEFRGDFCEMLGAQIDDDVFALLGALKLAHGQEAELWMLSNINELHYNYLRGRWPGIFSSFLEVFLSFKLGVRKPEEEIYKKVLSLGKASPAQCLFFDDLEENVLEARKVGLEAHRFSNCAGLRYDLASAGFILPRK